MKQVLITVVTYNRIRDLGKCIDALRNQTHSDFDILVVNNGSSDGTKEWLEQQGDIITINQENMGGAGGFYSGMRYMIDHDYQWLLMMDDDGIADKDELKNLLEKYENRKWK